MKERISHGFLIRVRVHFTLANCMEFNGRFEYRVRAVDLEVGVSITTTVYR